MTVARVDWAAASRPRPGESASGDRCLVVPLPDGALLAAVDGIGHGPEAAEASGLAVLTLEAHAERPLPDLVERCHTRLQRTRGATLSVARWNFHRRALEWLGVGNVEGLVLSASPSAGIRRTRLLLRGGLVGVHLPPLRTDSVTLPPECRLIFVTDGIASDFDDGLDAREPVKALADRILARSLKSADDALVVVARLGA